MINIKICHRPKRHVLYKLEGELGWYELELSGLIAAPSQLYPAPGSNPTTSVVLFPAYPISGQNFKIVNYVP